MFPPWYVLVLGGSISPRQALSGHLWKEWVECRKGSSRKRETPQRWPWVGESGGCAEWTWSTTIQSQERDEGRIKGCRWQEVEVTGRMQVWGRGAGGGGGSCSGSKWKAPLQFSVMGRPHCWLRVQEPRGEAGPQDQDSASGWRGRRWVWDQSKRGVHAAPEQQRVMPFKSHLPCPGGTGWAQVAGG